MDIKKIIAGHEDKVICFRCANSKVVAGLIPELINLGYNCPAGMMVSIIQEEKTSDIDFFMVYAKPTKEVSYSFNSNSYIETGYFVDVDEYDNVNHPRHYTGGKVECIDAMEQAFGKEAVEHFCLLNCFKYLWRFGDKNGEEDVDKAKWYFAKYKELLNS